MEAIIRKRDEADKENMMKLFKPKINKLSQKIVMNMKNSGHN